MTRHAYERAVDENPPKSRQRLLEDRLGGHGEPRQLVARCLLLFDKPGGGVNDAVPIAIPATHLGSPNDYVDQRYPMLGRQAMPSCEVRLGRTWGFLRMSVPFAKIVDRISALSPEPPDDRQVRTRSPNEVVSGSHIVSLRGGHLGNLEVWTSTQSHKRAAGLGSSGLVLRVASELSCLRLRDQHESQRARYLKDQRRHAGQEALGSGEESLRDWVDAVFSRRLRKRAPTALVAQSRVASSARPAAVVAAETANGI